MLLGLMLVWASFPVILELLFEREEGIDTSDTAITRV